VHGEAVFCATLVAPPASVLDAGCGTGRVAIRLAKLGYDVTGVDADRSMLDVARAAAPDLRWLLADLSTLTLPDGDRFDLVVAAGNVVPLLAARTLEQALARLAGLLTPVGQLVCGFGLDSAHLPPGCPVTELTAYDLACERAGLRLAARYATWGGGKFADQGYAVSVHRSE